MELVYMVVFIVLLLFVGMLEFEDKTKKVIMMIFSLIFNVVIMAGLVIILKNILVYKNTSEILRFFIMIALGILCNIFIYKKSTYDINTYLKFIISLLIISFFIFAIVFSIEEIFIFGLMYLMGLMFYWET